ncbi:MAG: hypothetical protein ACRDP8_06255 [Actinopolymorphaceae bacterium]
MSPAAVLGLILVVGVIVTVWSGLRVRKPGAGRDTAMPSLNCLFCHRLIHEKDQVAGLGEAAVRRLLGRVPTETPAATDPAGNRRWLGHVACASAAGVDLGAATRVGAAARPDPPVPAQAGDLVCPSCAHVFAPPDIMIVTRKDVRRYGRDPVQCPECDHIWDARRKIRTIRG